MRATGLPASRLSCSDAAAGPSAHARLPSPSRRRRTWGPSAFATSLRASITFGRTSRSMVPTRGAGALAHRDVLSGRDRRDAGATRSRGRRRACRHRFRAGHGQEAHGGGRLVDPAGGSLATATVTLMSIAAAENLKASVAADGRFRFTDVPAADYMLTIFDTSNVRSWNNAYRDLSVLDDVTDLQLVAGPSVWIDGRVVREVANHFRSIRRRSRCPRTNKRVSLAHHSAGFGKLAADGTFSMREVERAGCLCRVSLPPRWFVKSVRLDGVDVTDTEFELAPDGRRRLEVTVSDRVGRLSGEVTDREARAVSNALVVIFPEDRARWSNLRLSEDARYPYNVLNSGVVTSSTASDLLIVS